MAAASTLSAVARPFTNNNSPPSSAPVIRTPAISLSSPSTLSAKALPFIKSSSLHVPADSSSQPLSPSPLTPSSSSSGLVNRPPAISPSPSTLSAQATPFTKDSCLPLTADFSSPSPPPPPADTPSSASGCIIRPLAPSNLRAQARPYTKDSSVHVTADFSSLNPPPPPPPAAASSFGIITPHPTTSSSSSSLRAEARPFTKGSSTANFSSPPPTPPPPPIHTPFSSSSGLVIRPLEISPSPSILSHEAIPYTDDRSIHPKAKPRSLTLSATPYTPLSSRSFVPPSTNPTHVNDRPSLSSSFAPRLANSIPQSGVVGPPYYPPSAPPFVDSLPFDDDDVSMEPRVYPYSSYQVSSLPKGGATDVSSAYNPAFYEENSTAHYNNSEASLKGRPVIETETCNSSQVNASSARGTRSSMDYSMSKSGCVSHADHILALPQEFSTTQIVEGKEGYDEKSRANNHMKMNTGISVDFVPKVEGLSSSSGYDSVTGMSRDHSTEMKYGLKVNQLKLSSTFTSKRDSREPDGSMQNSSKILDQYDDVDSPCYIGTSTSQQSPFGVGETVDLQPTVIESKGCYDLDKGQMDLPTIVGNSKTLSSSEQLGNLVCNEKNNCPSVSHHKESSSDVILPRTQQKCGGPYIIGSDGANDDNGKGTQCTDICREQRNEVRKDKKKESEPQVAQLDREESVVSSSQPIAADGIANPETGLKGKPSSMGKEAQPIAEMTGYIQEKALFRCNSDAREWKDEHDLLQLENDYSQTVVLKNIKDITNGRFHVSGLEAARSQVAELKADAAMNQNAIHDMKGKGEMHSTGSSSNSEKFDNQVSYLNKEVKDMAQDVANGRFHVSGLDDSQSQVTGLKIDDAMNQNATRDMKGKGKMHSIGSSSNSEKFDHQVSCLNKEVKDMAQGIAKGSIYDSRLEIAQSQNTGLNGDVAMNQSNINTTNDTKGKVKTHSIGFCVYNDEFDDLASEHDKVKHAAQALEKIMKKYFCEDEENQRARLYKNLWIQEVTESFQKKYELQLALTETETANRKLWMAGGPQQVTGVSILNSMHGLGEHETPLENKAEVVDVLVMSKEVPQKFLGSNHVGDHLGTIKTPQSTLIQ